MCQDASRLFHTVCTYLRMVEPLSVDLQEKLEVRERRWTALATHM
jgi:hypothetical protein